MTGAIRRNLAENPSEFDPRNHLKPAREAAWRICAQRYREFGCEGQAAMIKPAALQDVASAYRCGKLAQTMV